MTKKIYLETLKSVLGRSILHNSHCETIVKIIVKLLFSPFFK